MKFNIDAVIEKITVAEIETPLFVAGVIDTTGSTVGFIVPLTNALRGTITALKGVINCVFSLDTFSVPFAQMRNRNIETEVREVIPFTPIEDVEPSMVPNFKADGGTNLHDAIGVALEKLLALAKELKKTGQRAKGIITVFYDGDNSDSAFFDSVNIQKMLQEVNALETLELSIFMMGMNSGTAGVDLTDPNLDPAVKVAVEDFNTEMVKSMNNLFGGDERACYFPAGTDISRLPGMIRKSAVNPAALRAELHAAPAVVTEFLGDMTEMESFA